MILKRLYLRNFRRYDESLLDLRPRINQIIAPNAQGKTTVLEAVQYLMTGRSFRTAQTNDLIRYGQDHFYIEAAFEKQGIEQSLKISFQNNERTIFYNSTALQTNAHLLGILQGVVTTPDDASLIKGSPLLRRHYLDLRIAQLDPLYVHYLTRYTKAMKQRNALLKSKNTFTIETWEAEMAIAAAYVVRQRRQAIVELQNLAAPLHQMLAGDNQKLILEYKSGSPDSPDLEVLRKYYRHQWHKQRNRELDLGITLTGPHRDDLNIKIDEHEARLFASEGQQRSCVLVLKLAEWERLYQVSGEKPLMLVDDVGISLDSGRRKKLLDHLQGLGQVLMTSTEQL